MGDHPWVFKGFPATVTKHYQIVISNARIAILGLPIMNLCRYLAVLALALSPQAGWPAADSDSVASARILPGWRADGGRHVAAVEIRLAPGWKTYWRAPGQAGIPPAFDWSGSQNLASVSVSFPVPDVFDQNGLRSVGYVNSVIFPLTLRAERAEDDITLRGQMLIGVCKDVCVPIELDVNALLPVSADRPDAAIRAALADRPMTAQEANLRDIQCDLEPISDGLRLTTRLDIPPLGSDETAVVEVRDPRIWVSEAISERTGRYLVATVDLVPPEAEPFDLAPEDVRITVLSTGDAVDIQGCG